MRYSPICLRATPQRVYVIIFQYPADEEVMAGVERRQHYEKGTSGNDFVDNGVGSPCSGYG
jgi:hypothetical protein